VTKRKAIPTAIKLRLFAESAGYCQKPDCLIPLYPAELGGEKHIAEMAHIIPHGDAGPRHDEKDNTNLESDSFENLILLCPVCHTIIDKEPEAFPRSSLLEWKREHLIKLSVNQGVKPYDTREEVRGALVAKLAENRAIWKKLAPIEGSEFEYNPESEMADLWEQRVKSVILPNHYKTQALIEVNLNHATEIEHEIFAEFKEHVRGLTERHVCNVAGKAIRFPQSMEGIFG
jgi:hypothetical protein